MAIPLLRPYKVSALHETHLALGARWVEEGEWRLPGSFVDPAVEAERVRQGVGLQDVSAIGKLDLKGGDAERLLAGLESPNQVSALHLTPGHVLLLTSPGRQAEIAEILLRALSQDPGCAHLTDVTSALSALALVGPRAREVLARLTSMDLRPQVLRDGACAQGGLAKVPVVILREDWGPLPAYCLLVQREFGEYAWEATRQAGDALGLVPFGLAAERLLRGRS